MNIEEIIGSTIFVVDDNKENLKVLVQFLSDIKINVVPLRSGEETLNLVKSRIPDMILLDIMMPGGIDGHETCRRLKANETTKDIPVIFMSALAETIDKVAGFNVGAVDYITKPFETEELLSRIHTHLLISLLQKELFEINTKLEEKVANRTEELRKTNIQLRKEIEERKQTEESRIQSEKKYRELHDNVPVGVHRTSEQGDIISVNPTSTKMFGYNSSEELMKVNMINNYASTDGGIKILSIANKEGLVNDYEVQLRRKDGSLFWGSVSVRRVHDNENDKIYYDGIIVDVTERKKAAAELQKLMQAKEMQKELIRQEKLASVGQLTKGIVDRILNPLNYINNFAKLSGDLITEINKVVDNEKKNMSETGFGEIAEITGLVSRNMQKIKNHGESATRIVKGMERLLKVKSNKYVDIEVNDLVEKNLAILLKEMEADFQDINVKIHREYSINARQVHVMHEEFGQVLKALLDNTLYILKEKKKNLPEFEPAIIFTTAEFDKTVEIRIKDNGTGMSKLETDKVFDPFFTTKSTSEGTGLGLYLCKEIIEMHKGNIKVNSKEGEFTEFIITLPSITAI